VLKEAWPTSAEIGGGREGASPARHGASAATARASSADAISESGDSAWRGSAVGPTGEDNWVA
jgi:hypothetical protein